MTQYEMRKQSENWEINRIYVEDHGTEHEITQHESMPGSVVGDKEKCITWVVSTNRRDVDLEHVELDYHRQKGKKNVEKYEYAVLGGFFIESAIRFGDIICLEVIYRVNLQERETAEFQISYSDYVEARIERDFKENGVMRISPEIPKSKREGYLQEAIRICLQDGGEIPHQQGFNLWNGKTVFASFDFYQANGLPCVVERRFVPDCALSFNEVGRKFVNAAKMHSDPELYLTFSALRLSGVLTSSLDKLGIRTPKLVFVKGDAASLAKYFQVYDRGYMTQKAKDINVKSQQFAANFEGVRDDVILFKDRSNLSNHMKQHGTDNIRLLEEWMTDSPETNQYLTVVFSERLAQEVDAERAIIVDASNFKTQLSDQAVTEVLYDFDRKIVNRICSEPEDLMQKIETAYSNFLRNMQWEGVTVDSSRAFLALLLALVSLVLSEYYPNLRAYYDTQKLQKYIASLVAASEKSCSGGSQVKEFELVMNQMIQNGELDLLLHHPLNNGGRSRDGIPPVFVDRTYLYFTNPAFEAVAHHMQLAPTACAVRKSLDDVDLLKPSDELQVKVTLFDHIYSGKQKVTAVRRSLLSEESLGKLQGGVYNYDCCEDADGSRILIGSNEQGKAVFISPKHPEQKNQHILVIGDSGSGKSTEGNMLARAKYESGENLIYVDYSNSNSKSKMLTHGFDEAYYAAHIEEIEVSSNIDCDELQMHLGKMKESHKILIFRFKTYGEYVEDFLLQLYQLIVDDSEMTVTLLIDEVHELEYEKGSALCHIMEKGRGNGISLIAILQAPHELKSMQLSRLNQASVKLIFGLNDRSDAEACLNKMSLKPLSKFAETISELKRRECLLVGELEDADGVICTKRYTKVTIPLLK